MSNKADFIDSCISIEGPTMAVFSGKLDNAADLNALLAKAGHAPMSGNAADIVVSLFEVFGPDSPNLMRGVFAGIVTNGRQLWCFRDHLGFKPLYYRDEPKAFFVATEAKQIITGAGLPRQPNLDAIEGIIFGKQTENKPCALRGVNHIIHASTYAVSIHTEAQAHRYWNPERFLETSRLNPTQIVEKFEELFGQAIARSLTGDDVVTLSGGIDSPAIAAFAAPQHLKLTGRPLSAISAVFPDLPKVDESQYIQLITKHLGIKLHTYRIQARTLDDVEYWCNLFDGPVPTISTPENYEIYALARQLGYRNVLTGEIAEYVFGFRAHIIGHLLTRGRWFALRNLITTELKHGRSRRVIAEELFLSLIPGRLINSYLRFRRHDHRQWIPDWVIHQNVKNAPYRPDLLAPLHKRWSHQQTIAFLGSTLIDEAIEICSELNGITVRRPFSDIDLWEFFLSLPAEIKIPDLRLKTFIRKLLRGKLPAPILDRSDKTAFNDHTMSQVNYPILRRFLVNPSYHIPGVDYPKLAARIERQELNLFDWVWATTLVRVHAFIGLC
jgi:asparagine synthase (glutamine-hydrolysing)